MPAVELNSSVQRSLAATSILERAGEQRHDRAHLRRAYAMTDDPEMRRQILLRLVRVKGTAEGGARS
jgi:hypothetical protein